MANSSTPRTVISSSEMDELCTAHEKDVRKLCKARPPRRVIGDPMRGKERAKEIQLLRLIEVEDDCADQEDDDEKERGKVTTTVPRASISHKIRPSKESETIQLETMLSSEMNPIEGQGYETNRHQLDETNQGSSDRSGRDAERVKKWLDRTEDKVREDVLVATKAISGSILRIAKHEGESGVTTEKAGTDPESTRHREGESINGGHAIDDINDIMVLT